MDNVIKFIKKNKIILLIILAIAIAAIVFFVVLKPNKKEKTYTLSSIEELKLKEVSNDIMPYFEEIEDNQSEQLDRYINFALEYTYDKKGVDSLSLEDMKKLINSKFNMDVSEEDLESIGITPLMLDKSITFEMMDKSYKINKVKLSLQDIAAHRITTYVLQGFKKTGENEFIGTYKKSVVTNPYEILNYYMDLNNKNSAPTTDPETGEIIEKNENNKPVDTTEITRYLKGEEKVSTIKKYINEDNISEIGEDGGTIEVKFIVKDDNIVIDSIKK